MTPEERARAVHVDCDRAGHDDFLVCFDCIADAIREAEERGRTEMICEYCHTNPATCSGTYEGSEGRQLACDDCCGHACEDGYCTPLSDEPEAKATGLRTGVKRFTEVRPLTDAELHQLTWCPMHGGCPCLRRRLELAEKVVRAVEDKSASDIAAAVFTYRREVPRG